MLPQELRVEAEVAGGAILDVEGTQRLGVAVAASQRCGEFGAMRGQYETNPVMGEVDLVDGGQLGGPPMVLGVTIAAVLGGGHLAVQAGRIPDLVGDLRMTAEAAVPHRDR